jgi:hypothetical protein
LRFDELRAALGMGPTEGEAWFHLSGRVIGFGQQNPNTRAIILRRWPPSGPIAIVFARTRVPGDGKYENPAHDHDGSWPGCWLRETAWIVLDLPLPVAKSALTDDVRLCSEEDAGTIAAVMSEPA